MKLSAKFSNFLRHNEEDFKRIMKVYVDDASSDMDSTQLNIMCLFCKNETRESSESKVTKTI